MLRNYLLTALRNLRKYKLYSFITIGGLAVGLAACLLILLFVRDELSYDKWIPNAERIAQVETEFRIPGRDQLEFAASPGPAKAALEKDFSSDIERVVRIYQSEGPMRAGDRMFNDTISYVDPGFFEVFDLPSARGQRDQVLDRNDTLIVSERMASKYFGDQPAIGKVITVDNKYDYQVVGVFEDLPRNTHLKIDFIALFDTQRYAEYPWVAERWTSVNVHTYVLFRSREAMARVRADLTAFVDRNVKMEIPGFENARISDLMSIRLMPLLDIHLYDQRPGNYKPGGDITTVITFSAVAALILLIACINFINLATARSMQRAREVAIRKVVGASRGQLIGQFLGEAFLTTALALLIALALVEVALGPYNTFLDKQLELDIIGDPKLLAMIVGLVVVVGLLGGTYPAIYLSRFRPAHVLKANQSSASGSTRLRNSLVVFQFAVSVALLISTAVVYGQNRYARNLDLGYQTANRLVIDGLHDLPDKGELAATLKRAVGELAHVDHVSLSSDTPPLSNFNNTVLYPSATISEEHYIIESTDVDADFFSAYGVTPLAGRLFSKDFPTDARNIPKDKSQAATQSIVVNQTFLRKVGIATPEAAIGKVLWDISGVDPSSPLIRSTIIGVVPDMHLRSIEFEITPLIYHMYPEESGEFDALSIEVEPGEMQSTLASVESIWAKLAPGNVIRTVFVDQELASQYDAIAKRGYMFGAFALFAVLVACLGLFGLASFAAERRTKEIGMRKTLGASVFDIIRLMMWQFSKPVLIANVLAWPAAFYLMKRWLVTFKYHIELTDPVVLVFVFGGAGLVALAIAWATVVGQATRVARANPIHALRCE